MPPKAKFTKEQITKAALGVVSEKGAQALTAKELGAALGTSTTPIFTVFNSMQEVQDEVMLAAMERFEQRLRQKSVVVEYVDGEMLVTETIAYERIWRRIKKETMGWRFVEPELFCGNCFRKHRRTN